MQRALSKAELEVALQVSLREKMEEVDGINRDLLVGKIKAESSFLVSEQQRIAMEKNLELEKEKFKAECSFLVSEQQRIAMDKMLEFQMEKHRAESLSLERIIKIGDSNYTESKVMMMSSFAESREVILRNEEKIDKRNESEIARMQQALADKVTT